MLSLLLAFATLASDDRPAAEWVIRQGGRVVAHGGPTTPIADLASLPSGPLRLAVVDLYGTIIDPKDLERLSGLREIRELYLPGPSWNPGAGSRLDANEELKFLAPLRSLEKLHFSLHFLTNVNVQDKGLKHLETLVNLKEIRLAQGRVQNFSFAVFTKLEGLDLSYSTATDEVLKGLANLRHLRRLNLRDTLVTDEGLAYLAKNVTLEEIDLSGLKISDRGLAHLKDLGELRRLNLLGGGITDAGAGILAGFRKMRDLNLYRAELTNAGVAKLAPLRDLAFLDIRYTRATAAGAAQLRSALPNCKIEISAMPSVLSTSKATPPMPPSGSPQSAWADWIGGTLHGRATLRDGRINTISLARTGVTDSQLATLAAAVPSLEDLDLDATEIGDLGLAAVIASCARLKRLKLDSTTVSDSGLQRLQGLRQLESLSLAGTLVRGLAPLPPSLAELDLSSTGIANSALPHLFALKSLRRLNLAYTALDQADLSGLSPSLRALDLTGTDIDDKGIAQIAQLTGLEELLLNHGRFREQGLSPLENLIHLRRLELVRTQTGGLAAATLAKLTKLEFLNLDYTPFTDEGLRTIAALPLVELRLDSANITDAAASSLASMKSLQFLNLYHTLISEEARNRLAKALPGARIVWDRDSKLPNRRGS